MRLHTLTAALAFAGLMVSTGGAATIGKSEARARVVAMEKEQADLLAKLPGLLPVDQAVREDCAAKVSGHASTDKFCTCGSAVTMSLWRSGIDPRMLGRLKDYLNGSGDLKAPDFVQFEGPELYRPLCELGA